MSDERETQLEELTQKLAEVQEELRRLAARRAELRSDESSNTAELEAIETKLAERRRRRTELQDRQLEIQRELVNNTVDDPGKNTSIAAHTMSKPTQDDSRRGLVRGLTTLILVMGLVVVIGGGLLLGATRFMAPPSVQGVENNANVAQEPADESKSLEQRVIGLYLALNREKIVQPAGSDDSPVVFRIEPGETAVTVANRLEENDLITDAAVFRRLIAYRGADQSLAAGTYQLRRNMTMDEIIVALQSGRQEEITVTIPEGWRAEQIAEQLEAQELFAAGDYLALVEQPAQFAGEFPFLADVPEGQSLEGFLFPDTYRVIQDEITPKDFIRMQLSTFDQRVPPALREAMSDKGMTLYQALTLASIVEREAVVEEERATIAGVFENRWNDGMHLNADPTVQYALGYQPEEETWWKRPLLLEDLEVDSPYNSYDHTGLPPSPICNPGLAAIRATATAPATEYYYFVSRGDGTHVFATTLEEHQQNVERYRQ